VQDYRWWWRSFLLGGSPAIYIFAYAILHAVLQMHGGDMIAGFLYVMHALAASLVIGIALGAISFITTYYVLRKLFKTTKAN
jgi:transmembrane 9 superfamily protein 2/4